MLRVRNHNLNGNQTMSYTSLKCSDGFCLYLKSILSIMASKALNDVVPLCFLTLIMQSFPPFVLFLKQARLIPQVTEETVNLKCPSPRFSQGSRSHVASLARPFLTTRSQILSYFLYLSVLSFIPSYFIFFFAFIIFFSGLHIAYVLIIS